MRIEDVIQTYEEDLQEMGAQVRTAMSMALEALVDNDKEKALKVIEKDEYINLADENINNQAIEALSLMQPVARDLRILIAGIKIATDFERIGDYAKNIARYVIRTETITTEYDDDIQALGELFLSNFDALLKVLKTKDVKAAYKVADLDDNVDAAFKKLLDSYVTNVQQESLFPIETTAMLRNIERAGDHAKNICEQIIYIVKGQHVDFG